MPQLLEGAPDPTPDFNDVLPNALIAGGLAGVAGSMAAYAFVDQASAAEEATAGVAAAVIGYAVGKVLITKALEFIGTHRANKRHLSLQAEVVRATALADEYGLRDDF